MKNKIKGKDGVIIIIVLIAIVLISKTGILYNRSTAVTGGTSNVWIDNLYEPTDNNTLVQMYDQECNDYSGFNVSFWVHWNYVVQPYYNVGCYISFKDYNTTCADSTLGFIHYYWNTIPVMNCAMSNTYLKSVSLDNVNWSITCWDAFSHQTTYNFNNSFMMPTATGCCGDGVCDSLENCSTCSADCGICPIQPLCGDGACNGNENCSICSSDCGSCPIIPKCGDGTCNNGENCSTCNQDCGTCSVPEYNCLGLFNEGQIINKLCNSSSINETINILGMIIRICWLELLIILIIIIIIISIYKKNKVRR